MFLGLFVAGNIVSLVGYMIALAIGLETASEEGATAALLALGVAFLATLFISLSAWVRRLHDMDQTGWLALLAFVPLVNILMFFVLLFASGTPGANRYGPQPGTEGRPEPVSPYAPPPGQRYAPRPGQPYAPRQPQTPWQPHAPGPPSATRADPEFTIMAQGLDRNFTPNGSPEWIRLRNMTGREFARQAAALGAPDPGGYVPNVGFHREGVRLVLYQEDATVWHATEPPPGMTDRVAVHQIPEWLEAGIAYAKRA